MSSPVSSGSDSRTENQKVRDTYSEREKRLKEKQQQDLARINKAHANEVKRLSAQQGSRDKQVSANASEAITRTDLKHQKDVAKIKKAHASQLRLKNAEHRDWQDQKARDYSRLSSKGKNSQKSQLKQMQVNHEYAQRASSEQTQQTVDQYRNKHHDEVQEIQRNQRRVYEERSNQQEDRHYNEKTQMAEKHEDYKLHKDGELHKLKRDNINKLDRQSRIYKANMDHKDLEYTETYKDLRDEQQIGHKQTQKKYSEALQEERQQMEATREKVYGSTGRLTEERDRKNDKIRDLRMMNQKDRGRTERQKKRELANLQDAQTKTLEVVFEERQGMVKEFNEINHKEINAANDRANQKIEGNYKMLSEKVKVADEKNNRDLARQREKLIDQNSDKIEKNRLRNESVRAENATERYRLKSMHDNQRQRLKNHHTNIIHEERFKNSQEREKLREKFTQKVKEMESSYTQKLNAVDDKHSKELISVKNRHDQQLTDVQQENRRVAIENQKAVKFRENNDEKKHEYKMGKVREAHREEMRILNAQYRENLRSLIRDRDSGLG